MENETSKQKLKKKKRSKPHKHGLIYQPCNPLNPTLNLNQEAQHPTNPILKDETREKNIN